jgi:hypothetical protein
MNKPEPQQEHDWLHQLVGSWRYEMQVPGRDGQPPATITGTETVRSIGGLWIVTEGHGPGADGGQETMQMTLGYDAQRGRFVGSFIASMMTHFWRYEGQLDASRRVLTLDTEGPSFSGDGTLQRYQDIVEVKGPAARTLSSRVQAQDGAWQDIMTMEYTRLG